MKFIRRILIGQAAAALLLAVTVGGTPALAATTVGNGTPASCTEIAFDTAFAMGGLITFNCGAAPLPIVFSSTKSTTADVTIDGGGLITLGGGNDTQLFTVTGGFTLRLKNIVLENGNSGNSPGGAIYNNYSTLILDHATIQNSHTSNQPGGAIHAYGGAITLTNNSLIQNNYGYNYGAINTTGALSIINSTIRNNTATYAGGGLSVGGVTTIDHSQIYSNTANGAGGGGGIFTTAPSRASLTDSQVYSNSAPDSSSLGGGIENFGTLTLTHASLSGNRASAGGGLSNESGGQAALDAVTVSGNQASGYSGGLNNNGTLTVTRASLSGNQVPSTGEGGGLGAGGNAVTTLSNSLVAGNTAGDGAGLASAGGPLTLTNVTLSDNIAAQDGGGLQATYGTATLTNVTFSGNSATNNGGAIFFYAIGPADSLTLTNTLVADSPLGGNCYVSPSSMAGIASAGFNLSSDNSCATYFNRGGDQNNTPALLWPLAGNGGLTQTYLPRHDSPAIDNGTGSGCPAADQRGLARPQGAACDIGAVEVQPADRVWPAYLPTLRR